MAAGDDEGALGRFDLTVLVGDETTAAQRGQSEGAFLGGAARLSGSRIDEQHRAEQIPGEAARVDGAGLQFHPGGHDVGDGRAELVGAGGVDERLGQRDPRGDPAAGVTDGPDDGVDVLGGGVRGGHEEDGAVEQFVAHDPRADGRVEPVGGEQLGLEPAAVVLGLLDLAAQLGLVVAQAGDDAVCQQPGAEHDPDRQTEEHRHQGDDVMAHRDHARRPRIHSTAESHH